MTTAMQIVIALHRWHVAADTGAFWVEQCQPEPDPLFENLANGTPTAPSAVALAIALIESANSNVCKLGHPFWIPLRRGQAANPTRNVVLYSAVHMPGNRMAGSRTVAVAHDVSIAVDHHLRAPIAGPSIVALATATVGSIAAGIRAGRCAMIMTIGIAARPYGAIVFRILIITSAPATVARVAVCGGAMTRAIIFGVALRESAMVV
jgi:hypothetical protein